VPAAPAPAPAPAPRAERSWHRAWRPRLRGAPPGPSAPGWRRGASARQPGSGTAAGRSSGPAAGKSSGPGAGRSSGPGSLGWPHARPRMHPPGACPWLRFRKPGCNPRPPCGGPTRGLGIAPLCSRPLAPPLGRPAESSPRLWEVLARQNLGLTVCVLQWALVATRPVTLPSTSSIPDLRLPQQRPHSAVHFVTRPQASPRLPWDQLSWCTPRFQTQRS